MAAKATKPPPKLDSGKVDVTKMATGWALLALAVLLYSLHTPAPPGPAPKTAFKSHYITNVFSQETLSELDRLMADNKVFKTAAKDLTAKYDHIGEALPIDDPGCNHPLLVPNADNTSCILPSRLDIARHFLKTGGPDSYQERYETMVPRMLSFIGYLFDDLNSASVKKLFDDPGYIAKATDVCQGRSVFDPIQLNLILMLPGQELPMHWDVPWLWGATRFDLPQWLLVVMEQSGLWANASVPQIQGVSWLHDGADAGGEFFFYPAGAAGPIEVVRAQRNAAIVVDGCRVVHGVRRFKPHDSVPPMSRYSANELRHVQGDNWTLFVDGKAVRNYKTSDFRMSLVWRARCFVDDAELARWHESMKDESSKISMETVLSTLEKDLRAKGVLSASQPRPEPIAFAELLLDTYAPYPHTPLPGTVLVYNLCMIPRTLPSWLRPVGDMVADWLC
jgi:hypothetical protein